MAGRLRLRVLPTALDDAESILRHIQRDSPTSSERFCLELGRAFSMLQGAPRLGRSVSEHQRRYAEVRRYLPRKFRKYVIYYAVEPGQIIILRVMHGAMVRSAGVMPVSE